MSRCVVTVAQFGDQQLMIRKERVKAGFTQLEAAKCLGYSLREINDMEHGRKSVTVAEHQRIVFFYRDNSKEREKT